MPKLGAAWDFQQQQIALLMKKSFEQVFCRPPRERLPTPPELHGLNLFICCKRGEKGG